MWQQLLMLKTVAGKWDWICQRKLLSLNLNTNFYHWIFISFPRALIYSQSLKRCTYKSCTACDEFFSIVKNILFIVYWTKLLTITDWSLLLLFWWESRASIASELHLWHLFGVAPFYHLYSHVYHYSCIHFFLCLWNKVKVNCGSFTRCED